MAESLRFNEGKPEVHYILFYRKFLEALSFVQSQGAIKYGYGNWTGGGKPDSEYFDAGMRHLLIHFAACKKIVDPATGDPTSYYDEDLGVLHIAQAIWNFMQLVELNLDIPLFNPEFDQEDFINRWSDFPKFNAFER